MTAFGTAGITGLMRERLLATFAAERQSHATAARLSAALDQVDIGIVLLDAETRAEFINRAFRDYFALPDEIADGKPPFIALMYHGRDTGAFELPEDELSTFIAQRMINSIAATAEHSSLHGRERKKAVPSPVPGCDPTASLALAPDRLLRVEPVPDWT